MNLPPQDFLPLFGRRLRALREDCDLRQKDVAAYLGVNQSHYARYELGKAAMPIWMLPKIVQLFHTDINYLLCMNDI